MEDFNSHVKALNKRLLIDGRQKIVPLGKNSKIWISQQFLDDFDCTLLFNTQCLKNEEVRTMIGKNSNDYTTWAMEVANGNLAVDCALAAQPLFLNDARRDHLCLKLGLCYDFDSLLNEAKRGGQKQVENICKKDLFLINAIDYLYNAQNFCQKLNIQFPDRERKILAQTIKSVANAKDFNADFPKNLQTFKTPAGQIDLFIENDLKAINLACKKGLKSEKQLGE